MKRAKEYVCQNPTCDTNDEKSAVYGKTFTISTALDEKSFCSLSCEQGKSPRMKALRQ